MPRVEAPPRKCLEACSASSSTEYSGCGPSASLVGHTVSVASRSPKRLARRNLADRSRRYCRHSGGGGVATVHRFDRATAAPVNLLAKSTLRRHSVSRSHRLEDVGRTRSWHLKRGAAVSTVASWDGRRFRCAAPLPYRHWARLTNNAGRGKGAVQWPLASNRAVP